MRVFKVLVILFLVAVIIVGGMGSYWFLVLRPKQIIQREEAAARRPAGQPTPDPSTPEFERAVALRQAGQPAQARDALIAFINARPDSSHRAEAENLLGSINVDTAFSAAPGPDKVLYTVKSGDVLDRVARHYKVNADLIYRASRLENVNLKIGQKLVVPTLEVATEIHLKDRRVLLFNRGQFFRSYPIRQLHVPAKKSVDLKGKVKERIAVKDGVRVTFPAKEFTDSLRAVVFDQPGYTVFALPPEGSAEKPPATTGVALEVNDAREFYTLVKVGDPVAISSE